MNRPGIGRTELLVYRECPQGCWCATGEGARAPLCAEHHEPMHPGGGPVGMFGAEDGGDHNEVMRARRLGFAALFGNEQQMLERVRQLGGRPDPAFHHEVPRYYSEAEIAGRNGS